ncbi:uncharacterized protein L3040_003773 [Drepanopeziza brunnea f. sp. 'multigermtubi']|uniref:uncharacterized protein n=1 Tax=Drepanopeziza brunnea f. sp. 'multigermtubi' TaxID=698441 RepID=UPI00239190C4|nr:hypothetical protein L3040_003773 [Drepanopeziza brunnea f. sp. 'multigermtubi']
MGRRSDAALKEQCTRKWKDDMGTWMHTALNVWMGRAVSRWKKSEATAKRKERKHKIPSTPGKTFQQVEPVPRASVETAFTKPSATGSVKAPFKGGSSQHQESSRAGPTQQLESVGCNGVPENSHPSSAAKIAQVKTKSRVKSLLGAPIRGTVIKSSIGGPATAVCQEYDDFVTYVVHASKVRHKVNLLPHDYDDDDHDGDSELESFRRTAERFRAAVRERAIEDGILKRYNATGCNKSYHGTELDDHILVQDYPERRETWAEEYFTKGCGPAVKTAMEKVLSFCALRHRGCYVPPGRRAAESSTANTKVIPHLELATLTSADCAEYLDLICMIVRKALRRTSPQAIYETAFLPARCAPNRKMAKKLLIRAFRRMVKDNILEHNRKGGYDLCSSFEAKRFFRCRHSFRTPDPDPQGPDLESEQSLSRLERFLDANVDSISQNDLIRLYGPEAASYYDRLQSEMRPKVKFEIVEDEIKSETDDTLDEVKNIVLIGSASWPIDGSGFSKPLPTSFALSTMETTVADLRKQYPDDRLDILHYANSPNIVHVTCHECNVQLDFGFDPDLRSLAAHLKSTKHTCMMMQRFSGQFPRQTLATQERLGILEQLIEDLQDGIHSIPWLAAICELPRSAAEPRPLISRVTTPRSHEGTTPILNRADTGNICVEGEGPEDDIKVIMERRRRELQLKRKIEHDQQEKGAKRPHLEDMSSGKNSLLTTIAQLTERIKTLEQATFDEGNAAAMEGSFRGEAGESHKVS